MPLAVPYCSHGFIHIKARYPFLSRTGFWGPPAYIPAPEANLLAIAHTLEALDARFIIDLIPLGGSCSTCAGHFIIEDAYIWECPFCVSQSFQITQGYEMQIVKMEVN